MVDNLLIIGAGPMAIAYAQVLKAMGQDFEVVGRGEASANSFNKATGIIPFTGGLDNYLARKSVTGSSVIITTGEEMLTNVCEKILEKGGRKILLEKPGALDVESITRLDDLTSKHSAEVVIAYNRRFYSSVDNCRRMIEEDGGVASFNFEFTEWSHEIEKLEKVTSIKKRWFLVNSTHVIDLAFYLGSKPKSMHCCSSDSLPWHSISRFSGSGVSNSDALFSYHANWNAPGRWRVEILTDKRKYILCPLEKLQVQEMGSVNVAFIDIDDHLDQDFKPGIYRQTEAFLRGDYTNFCTLRDQKEAFQTYYNEICPY